MTASLLPPNATALERALEALTERLDDIAVPLRELWRPDEVPLELLSFLAWALSIDAWNPDWPEGIKREWVSKAIAIQRRKGTAGSVRAVVAAFGGQIALKEWWQMDPPGDPHTFGLVINLTDQDGEPATAQFVAEVIDEVSRTKPARAHFDFTQGLTGAGQLRLAGGARAAGYRRFDMIAA